MVDLSQHRILIVDDEMDNLIVLQATLELMYEAQTHTAQDAKSALAIIDSFRPTLIVTDLSMPQVDGYALFQKLRSNPATRDLPVIAVTAHAMAGDRERIIEVGFDGYISKPFDVAHIGEQLIDLLILFERTHKKSWLE
jgi:CheY-like chemotaxis protein